MKYDFIEIGTADFDTLIETADDSVTGLSIEPIKFYLDRLPNKEGVKKINCAIGDVDKDTHVYWVPPDKIDEYGLPEWVRGCGSVDNPHVLISEDVQEPLPIRMITWDRLIDDYDIGSVEYLKIDAEGYDFNIIEQILESPKKILPNKIKFEQNYGKAGEEKDNSEFIKKLKIHGYIVVEDDVKNLVVIKDPLLTRCPALLELGTILGPTTEPLLDMLRKDDFTRALSYVNHYLHPSEDDFNVTVKEFYSLVKIVSLEGMGFIEDLKTYLLEILPEFTDPNHEFLGLVSPATSAFREKAAEFGIDYFQVSRFQHPRKLKIAIYAPWWAWTDAVTPLTFETEFFAGSEYMTYIMGEKLAELGHDVTVYSKPKYDFEMPSGTKWRHANDYPFDDSSIDILVISRDFTFIQNERPAAKKIFTWHHDFGMTDIAPVPQENYDRLICMSMPHANFYAKEDWCNRNKLFVSRNGIEVDLFRGNVVKDPYKIVFASEADRGLTFTIEVFKKIKEKFPQASLHAFYANMHDYLEYGETEYKNTKIDRGRKALKEARETEGVFIRGGLPHKQFVHELRSASLWIYWQQFWETSCIVAMEAQASRIPVIVTSGSALSETVAKESGIVFDQREVDDMFDAEVLAEHAIKILENKELSELYGDSGYIYAMQNYDITNVAREWVNLFTEVLNANN